MPHKDEQWKVAEAALEEARSLPGGPERIQALKDAGKLRFAADERRKKGQSEHGRPSALAASPRSRPRI